MKQVLLTVGRPARGWAAEGAADYLRRLRGLEEQWVKPEPFRGDEHAVRDAEGARLLAATSSRDRIVALDERGDDLSTTEFVALVDDGLAAEGRLIWAIGGAYGHAPAVRASAWRVVRLSSLVLNHELARVLLAEQLYRVSRIQAGAPYHH